MSSKAELLASLIEQQKALTEQAAAVAAIEKAKSQQLSEQSTTEEVKVEIEPAQEYVYWARRGEFDTAGEVEVSSSGSEQTPSSSQTEGECEMVIVDVVNEEEHASSSQGASSHVFTPSRFAYRNGNSSNSRDYPQERHIADFFPRHSDSMSESFPRRGDTQAEKLHEQMMNEEYQKAIGYLLCTNKSKSGKQKKKQTMTAYLFFCRRYRPKIVARNPKMSFTQISKLLSHMWRNAPEHEKNIYRIKLEQHRTKVNAIVEKNMIEKMKLVKQQKLMEDMRRRGLTVDDGGNLCTIAEVSTAMPTAATES